MSIRVVLPPTTSTMVILYAVMSSISSGSLNSASGTGALCSFSSDLDSPILNISRSSDGGSLELDTLFVRVPSSWFASSSFRSLLSEFDLPSASESPFNPGSSRDWNCPSCSGSPTASQSSWHSPPAFLCSPVVDAISLEGVISALSSLWVVCSVSVFGLFDDTQVRIYIINIMIHTHNANLLGIITPTMLVRVSLHILNLMNGSGRFPQTRGTWKMFTYASLFCTHQVDLISGYMWQGEQSTSPCVFSENMGKTLHVDIIYTYNPYTLDKIAQALLCCYEEYNPFITMTWWWEWWRLKSRASRLFTKLFIQS